MALRACAEPTRLRLLALADRGAFCVMDLVAILGQSQPRLSRHLRLLHEAGLLDRTREGANVWLALPPAETEPGSLVRSLLARLPEDDATLLADRRAAARVLAERARIATEAFQQAGDTWDEARALNLDAEAIEAALLDALPPAFGRLLDIGTGTGRLLEVLAPRADGVVGVDASRAMLALARGRLARMRLDGATDAAVRQGDMYRLPFPDGLFDAAVMHMLLHHADDPAAAVAEAARVLAPGGRLVVIDLAPHAGTEITRRLAHRHLGFPDATVAALLTAAGLRVELSATVPGPLPVRLWCGLNDSAVSLPAPILRTASLVEPQ